MLRQTILVTTILSLLSMVAFALNSVLNRMALAEMLISPAGFTMVRLVSGAIFLVLILRLRGGWRVLARPAWPSAMALAAYALGFSLAYHSLDAAVGALLLFGAVQATMIGWALMRGDRPGAAEWLGIIVAFAGLLYLLAPGVTAPPFVGALLMIAAGIAWGLYSLWGQGEPDPIAATARNFLYAAPLGLGALLLPGALAGWTTHGVALALASGILTSGLGYVLWYSALRGLKTSLAAVIQLSVPVLAAWGGVALVGEPVGPRFPVASLLILGGILVSVLGARRPARATRLPDARA